MHVEFILLAAGVQERLVPKTRWNSTALLLVG
jgi:hypothetical protein